MKDSWKFISNPFYKVAGYKAAGWGILGIVITTEIAYGADAWQPGWARRRSWP